jgi:hypothetical protein
MEPSVYRRDAAITLLGERLVRRNVAARRWVSLAGVVVCHNGPLTPRERLEVAVLAVKPGRSAADRLSVLATLGAIEHPDRPQVALAVGTHAPPIEWVDYSWVTDLRSKVRHRGWLPILSPGHAVLRAGAVANDARAARTLVCRALQRKAVTANELRDALGRAPRWRYSAIVRETLEDFEGGIQSVPEKEFAVLLARAGLPAPTRQRLVRGGDGRYYLDADWDEFNLGAEVHGWQHWEFAHRESDNWRTADIVAGGRRLIAFSSWAIRHEPERVVSVLTRALAAGGWRR